MTKIQVYATQEKGGVITPFELGEVLGIRFLGHMMLSLLRTK